MREARAAVAPRRESPRVRRAAAQTDSLAADRFTSAAGRCRCSNYHYYVPVVPALLLGPGAFLPRPEDRRQPPFLDQLYASNGGCSMSMCHRVGAGAVQWGRGGEAGWPAAPPGRLLARTSPATLLARHAVLPHAGRCRVAYARSPARAALRILRSERDGRCEPLRAHLTETAARPPSGRALAQRALAAACATSLPPSARPERAITAARLDYHPDSTLIN